MKKKLEKYINKFYKDRLLIKIYQKMKYEWVYLKFCTKKIIILVDKIIKKLLIFLQRVIYYMYH